MSSVRSKLIQYGPTILLSIIILGGFWSWVTIQSSWYDPDTFWHLRVGQDIIENARINYTAINTFQENLPFIPHEAGFQILFAAIFEIGGWHVVHILTGCCFILLIWGLYRLAWIGRKESRADGFNPLLHAVIACVAFMIYAMFFKIRPQMVSTPAILWFFIWMRRYQSTHSLKSAMAMVGISLIISNMHAGVFPILVVFWALALAEALFGSTVQRGHVWVTAALLLSGLCNADPLHSVLYIGTASQSFSGYINEWMPVNFREYPLMALALFVYVWGLWASKEKSLFRLLLGLSVLFLGVACYKTLLFMLVFLPYEVASSIETIPFMGKLKQKVKLTKRLLPVLYVLAFSLFWVRGLLTPYTDPVKVYPVQEMQFILETGISSPKVLATYQASGYLMYRNARVLADGRYDPFIQKSTRSARNRTAFERSLLAAQSSDDLLEILQADRPDFLILPNQTHPSASRERILYELGEPAFKGSYGLLFRIHN